MENNSSAITVKSEEWNAFEKLLKAKEFLADVSGETELIGQSNP